MHGRCGDGCFRGVIRVNTPKRVLAKMSDLDRRWLNLKKISGESLDVLLGDPRRPKIGVDVAGEYVLRLHATQRFDMPGIVRPGIEHRRELGTHVTRKILV